MFNRLKASKVTLISCIFSNNTALKGSRDSMGRGGGLSIEANSLTLVMKDTLFINNQASDLGLSVYISQGVTAALLNCTFKHEVTQNNPLQQALLFAAGTATKFDGKIHVTNARPDADKGSFNMFYIGKGIEFNIGIHCPIWYKHALQYTSVSSDSQSIPDIRYQCIPCSDNYYTTVTNENIFVHNGSENNAIQNQGQNIDSCEECPYGAVCSGNDVIPRPNYWGSWYDGELVFQQCPAGYCCSGSSSSTCSVYDYCAGNKTGILCGGCQKGFSVAILTGACTPDRKCGEDNWFWLVAWLITVAYALWYTFKDDIFAFFFASIRFMRNMCHVTKLGKISNIVPADHIPKTSPLADPQVDEASTSTVIHVKENNPDIPNDVSDKEDDVDKGYFGIVTYYVQMAAVIKIQIEFSDIDKSDSFLDKIVENIGRFLNIELTQMSFDACPVVGLTSLGRHIYNLAFLFGIYISWAGMFSCTLITLTLLKRKDCGNCMYEKLTTFRSKLIGGLVEIIKYTYAGFCGIIFMSLVCVQVGTNYVWWYDATNVCLETWQILIVLFAVLYAVPLPFVLLFGMKLLKHNKISALLFILCCLCPPSALYYMIFKYTCVTDKKEDLGLSHLSQASENIMSVLQGPYREDSKHMTLYWEAMVCIRRLMITAMTLCGYASIEFSYEDREILKRDFY